jgi:phosphoglycolate phosphatase-like HAD superfamily hydrolase
MQTPTYFESSMKNSARLQVVENQMRQAQSRDLKPVTIFDLDETLLDSRERALRVFMDIALSVCVFRRFREECKYLLRSCKSRSEPIRSYVLYPDRILRDDFKVEDEAFIRAITPLYLEAYLSSAYCRDDQEIGGASAYVGRLFKAGSHIVYLTGRNRPNMEEGTLEALSRLGFPLGASTTLLMKPDPQMDDRAYKKSALEQISRLGSVVAAFDNEPAHLTAIEERFPDAILGFVETVHSDGSGPLPSSAFRVRDFNYRRSPQWVQTEGAFQISNTRASSQKRT